MHECHYTVLLLLPGKHYVSDLIQTHMLVFEFSSQFIYVRFDKP